MAFTYPYTIKFADVDAAGLVYYPRYFNICHLALEALFEEKSPIKFSHFIYQRRLGLPIVKVEAEYNSPLWFEDRLDVELAIMSIGTSSVKTRYRFLHGASLNVCFLASVTTVCTDLDKKRSMPLPQDLRDFLACFMVES
ncbi:MAG TPA: thioesterase family protein [Myxococcota bacterium]|nr:thioesterase family protein [Myxococcota bacterium]